MRVIGVAQCKEYKGGGRPVIESSSNYYFISKYLLTIKGIARRVE